jgi:NAD-dependent dihydropyrimidine dehydrogenase PreA subunit
MEQGPVSIPPPEAAPFIHSHIRSNLMTHVITEPCIGEKDKSCVDVCPVDCIHEIAGEDMLFIDPSDCIDCGLCVPECPVDAIFFEDDVPEQWAHYIEKNAAVFR